MLLGLVVVLALGTLLLQRIQSGLIEERLAAARGEAARGLRDAQAQLDTVNDSSGLNVLVNDMLPRLASPEPDDSRDVILLRGLGNDRPSVLPDLSSRDLDRQIIPMELRRRVVESGRQEGQYVRLRYTGSSRSTPGIAIGSRVAVPIAGEYELYFVFSLDREQETINLVRRSLIGGGIALVLLVGGVAYMVTRQVVRPVRQAAMVAQRLSSGRLQERMVPRGEDDLARLAASFNTMAHNLQTQISQLEHLSRVQQRFVSDVSHELRTPLTTIRMAGDVLHEARVDFAPAVARSAELLQTQLDRFEALLGDLLEISRIDAGGDLLDVEPVDLRDLVSRVAEAAGPLTEHQRQPARRRPVVRAGRRRGRPAADRADPAQPRGQRPRARQRQAGRGAHRLRRPRGRGVGARPRRRAATGRGGPGVQPLLARRPLPRPHGRAARASACRSPSRTPGCTAGGCRPGASPARGRASGSPCRARPAAS